MPLMTRRAAVAAIAALAAVLVGAPQGARAELADITSRGTLKVAVPQDFPPFGSVGLDMTPQGYDIDVAKLIAEKLGVKIELTPVTSANRIPFLQTNKVDLVISSLGKNPDREKVIDFSVPYAPFFNGVFAPDNIAVTKVEDLSGKTVGVTRGSVEDLELTKIIPADATVKRYDNNNGTISAFLSGQVQVVATGNVVAAAIIEKNPPKKPLLKFLIKNSPCFVGFNKEQPNLKAKVDEIITAAKADGTMNAIAQKWLKTDLPSDL